MNRQINHPHGVEGRPPTYAKGEPVNVVQRLPLPEWRYHERHGGGVVEGDPETRGGKNRIYSVRCRCGDLYEVRGDLLEPRYA